MAIHATETVVGAADADRQSSHIDWAALFAGAFVATAVAYVLTTFGSAVGLSMTSPYPGRGATTPVLLVAVGLWVVWVAASSFMAGGYVAGRMRRRLFDATEHEVDVRDSIHGVVVWAVASLFGAVLIGMTAAGAAKTGAQATATAVSGMAQGAALGAGAAAGQQGDASDPLRGIVDRVMRQAGASGGDPRVAAENAGEVGRIMRDGLAAGDVAEEDRAYLASVVARSTGVAPDEARKRVDQGIEQAKAAAQKARDAADKARKAAVIAAFVLAASLAIGLAAAIWGAGLGGRHRDQGTIVPGWAWR